MTRYRATFRITRDCTVYIDADDEAHADQICEEMPVEQIIGLAENSREVVEITSLKEDCDA